MKDLLPKITAWKNYKYARIGTVVLIAVVMGVVSALCAGCSGQPASPTTIPSAPAPTTMPATEPPEPQWVEYDASEDAPFLPKDIFSGELYVPGLVLGQSGATWLDATDRTDVGAFVIKGEYGKCYEIKIPAGVPCAVAVRTPTNPRALTVGQQLTDGISIQSLVQEPTEEVSFMYTCRTYLNDEYLVIYTGKSDSVYIGERTIITQTDTQGPWYIPEAVGNLPKEQRNWTSEEIFSNLYEPVRSRYPDYITRTSIGKDETGEYEMYCYEYAPENYEVTIFLNGGTHGDEIVGYFTLAKAMQLIADATPEDPLLYTIRQKVRFVVVPLVNVWSISTNHCRENKNGQDLNRDFEKLSQQETKNVMACFAQYAEDVSVAMDFHIGDNTPSDVAVYFNFINYAENAVVNYKTTNHLYQRYKELGHAETYTNLLKVPGSYKKGSKYFEGLIWNQYGIPTITIEYLLTRNFPMMYSDECMTLALETYMNFIIQNSLFYLQKD